MVKHIYTVTQKFFLDKNKGKVMSVTERREKIANSNSDRYFKKGRAILTYKEKSAYVDYDLVFVAHEV